MGLSEWTTSYIQFNLCWFILIIQIILEVDAQVCPQSKDWARDDCWNDCDEDYDCEGNLLCCHSFCGRHCVTQDFVPPPPSSKPAINVTNDSGPLAGQSTTNTVWYYYAAGAGGALILLVVISLVVYTIVRRRKAADAAANENNDNILSTPPPPPPPRTPKRNTDDIYCYIDEQDSAPSEMAPVPALSTVTHQNDTVAPAVFPPNVIMSPHNVMTSPQAVLTSQGVVMTSPPDVVMASPVVGDDEFMAVAFANNPTLMNHEEWSRMDFTEEGWVAMYPPPSGNLYVPS